ncbi:XRE family transcriptional regulator [Myroides odoratus]|uniref:XRE family transcriptional regulator n=1 Tax=Myroides odoratus TaxID=256 RepID=UPI0039B0F611
MEEKTIIENPGERIKMIAKAMGITVQELSSRLGYKTQGTLSSIIYGQTSSITLAFAENAVKQCPEINYLFLTKGELPVLVADNTITQLQKQMLGVTDEITNQQILAKLDVISKTQIRILKEIEELKKK